VTTPRGSADWPTYDDKSVLGQVGVSAVALSVSKNLQWGFRDKPTIDLGIDGEIEVREEDGTSRGRLISVQIKCGQSFFRSESEHGFRYRPKPQHLNYWLSHSTPVLLVLVDENTHTCYWQHVTAERLRIENGSTSSTCRERRHSALARWRR